MIGKVALVSRRALLKAALHTHPPPLLQQWFLVASFSLRDHEWPRQESLTSALRAEGARGMSAQQRMTGPDTIKDTVVMRPLSKRI